MDTNWKLLNYFDPKGGGSRSSNRWYLPTRLHVVTTHKTTIRSQSSSLWHAREAWGTNMHAVCNLFRHHLHQSRSQAIALARFGRPVVV